ncbi:hypothetical protein M407DRAFT_32209 [Tulasnella calospora MUT 4182]|uniref:DUF6535 domain-containing protein n=1 Tax=Tulasnella calospora MUT 4182 TaxID=1051891 RepID=A0A0C3Q557_9AGAM|nr:hypothetical protein M407DRAFT_32209 [Tulasnella calospora MUT 4182]
MTTRLPEKLTEMLELPKELGDDGGHFFRYYDDLAEESDEDLVKNLKAQLDGILIFAGLFAGVNTAFLAFTLPQMSADPADDTNALLLQIALGGNGSITSAADLPSASFTPPPRIYPINVLFSVSLTLALLSSFLAVLGQQWVVYYRKRGGGGPEYQRWEQLRRYLGAKRWRLELVLDDVVPSLLQLGLVIFCIAFALYLGTLSQSLNRVIAWLLGVAAATILAMSTCSAFDPWCPFKMPLSRITRSVAPAILAFVPWLIYCSLGIVIFIVIRANNANRRATVFRHSPELAEREHNARRRFREAVGIFTAAFAQIYRWFTRAGIRSPEDPEDLKIEALRRVICTSEDHNVLIYSAINLQVVRDTRALSSLGKDEEFCTRLSNLARTALRETRLGQSSRYSVLESRLFSTSFFHVILSTDSNPYFLIEGEFVASERISIPFDQMRHLHEGSIIAFDSSCDQCSHCAPLQFSIRVAYQIAESWRSDSRPNLDTAFKSAVGISVRSDHLKLGYMMASVMLFSKQWNDEGLAGHVSMPWDRFLNVLFAAYRETSEQRMFQTTSRALTTVSAEWRGKPDHEIYGWLFELYLLPGTKEVSAVDQHPVLEHVDDHLLSIERQVRFRRASEADRQRGRDQQNRCIQAVANWFVTHKYSSERMWSLIGHSLMQYLESVIKLMEADPGHPENPRTMMVLRRIEASFPAPNSSILGAYGPYSRFRRLLGRMDPSRAREVYQDLGLPYQRLSCIRQRGETWCNEQGPEMHILAL